MEKSAIFQKILDGRIVAILRVRDSEKIVPLAKSILAGGIHAIEVTMNTPNALQCIEKLSEIEGLLPGIGTVTNAQMAEDAIRAGAEFVVTPITKKEIIDVCHQLGKPVLSGAFSPSEVFQAHEWGADMIKIFPADALDWNYIKSISGPFPDIKLMPTGGVSPDNINKWFDAGSACVGVGGSFTNAEIIENEEWGQLQSLAKEYVDIIAHYKSAKKSLKSMK